MYNIIVGAICLAYIFFIYGYSHNKYYESDFSVEREPTLLGNVKFYLFFLANILLYPFLIVYSFGWLVSAFETLAFLASHLSRLQKIRDGQGTSLQLRTMAKAEIEANQIAKLASEIKGE